MKFFEKNRIFWGCPKSDKNGYFGGKKLFGGVVGAFWAWVRSLWNKGKRKSVKWSGGSVWFGVVVGKSWALAFSEFGGI